LFWHNVAGKKLGSENRRGVSEPGDKKEQNETHFGSILQPEHVTHKKELSDVW